MAIETVIVDTWLASVLSMDATLSSLLAARPDVPSKPGVYSDVTKQGAAFPYVLFQATDPGQDVVATGAIRVMVSTLYLVRGVIQGESYAGVLAQIASRIDVLLHKTSGPVAGGGTIVSCVRQSLFKLPETQNGISYRHLGGIFRINVQA